MSLKQWQNSGWLRPHTTSRQEIANLLGIVIRDMEDARREISSDWRFGIAYNAALKLCTILLNASVSDLRRAWPITERSGLCP